MPLTPFEANHDFLGTFLSQNKIRVPELQRPFAWDREQAKELAEDLKRALNADGDEGQHFFGTFVLLTNHQSHLSIIDGQQRLTTTTLALGLIEQEIRRIAKQALEDAELENNQIALNAIKIADNIHGYLWFPGPPGADLKVKEELRLTVSPEIKVSYEALVSGKPLDRPPILTGPDKKLRRVAEVLTEQLVVPKYQDDPDFTEKVRRLNNIAESITNRLIIVSVRTGSSSAGYDLFESLNSRGNPLTVLDLVKVWILSNIENEQEPRAAKLLRGFQTSDDPMKFFTDYFRLRVLRHPRPKVKLFAQDARTLLFSPSTSSGETPPGQLETHIMEELENMERLYPVWKELQAHKTPTSLGGAPNLRAAVAHRQKLLIDTLRHGFGSHGGLIWSLLLAVSDHTESPEEYAFFVHAVERFFFRFKVIGGNQIAPMESAYFEILRSVRSGQGFSLGFAIDTLQKVLDIHSPEERFLLSAREKLAYQSGSSIARIRYALYLLDSYATKSNKHKIPMGSDDFSFVEIEHIAPQNAAEAHGIPDHLINDFGNLCLLDAEMNQKLTNKNFAKKRQIIAQLAQKANPQRIRFVLSRAVFEDSVDETWGEEQIEERWTRLSKQLLSVTRLK